MHKIGTKFLYSVWIHSLADLVQPRQRRTLSGRIQLAWLVRELEAVKLRKGLNMPSFSSTSTKDQNNSEKLLRLAQRLSASVTSRIAVCFSGILRRPR